MSTKHSDVGSNPTGDFKIKIIRIWVNGKEVGWLRMRWWIFRKKITQRLQVIDPKILNGF